MSVIGVSPSDIVGGVRIAKKAVAALKPETGARVQYQAFKQSHDHFNTAVKALSETCSSLDISSSAELGLSLEHLVEKHEQQEKHIRKYEESLGEASSLKKRKSIRRKLQWAFQDEVELKDCDARSRLAVDAAILQTLHVQNGIAQRDHTAIENHVSAAAETTATRMQQNLEILADHTSHLAKEILTENKQQVQRLIDVLSSMNQAQDRAIARSLHHGLTNSAPTKRKFQRHERRKRVCKKSSQNNQKLPPSPYPSLPGSFPTPHSWCEVSGTSITGTSTSHSEPNPIGCMTDVSRTFWALLFTILYANPQSHRLARRLWSRIQIDPVLALLCLICAVLVRRCLVHVPKQISLLSDSSIIFEDAFGIEIHVPYQQCQQFEFFHGFLEFHFRQKPGFLRVVQKQYRLLLGNARGQMIERTTWTKSVKPKTRLTMAILLVSAQNQCAKCFGELEICSEDHVRKCFACDQVYSVEILTTQNQGSAPQEAVKDQSIGMEQLNLSYDHWMASSEEQTAVDNMMSLGESDRVLEGMELEVNATKKAHTSNSSAAIDTPHKSSPTSQQEPKSINELELKLFKNMAIRVIPQASALRPMLPLDSKIDDDGLSTTANTEPIDIFQQLILTPLLECVYDDMAVAEEPTQHVDYLSYDWTERQVQLSWRYVKDRRQTLVNSTRLENAAWRFWAQKRAGLKTVEPESINWMKDCDVTWLYGPLQPDSLESAADSNGKVPNNPGLIPPDHKKSILKRRRRAWDVVSVQCQSQHSLLKRATDIIKLQQSSNVWQSRGSRAVLLSTSSDQSTIDTPSDWDKIYSRAGSHILTPDETKHVFFNQEVQQVQAVDIEGGEFSLMEKLASASLRRAAG